MEGVAHRGGHSIGALGGRGHVNPHSAAVDEDPLEQVQQCHAVGGLLQLGAHGAHAVEQEQQSGLLIAVGDAPVISGINGLLGFLAGAVQGFLYVWILMYLVALTGATAFSQQIITYIYQNAFLVYLYQHNAVMAIVEIFL